jgi:poly(A) polymerase
MISIGNAFSRLLRRTPTNAQEPRRLNPENRNLPSPEPRIVPRAAHTLSRKHISPGALRVLYRLHESGYAAYLVGGAVRDLLLGGHPKDFDVATDATPEQVRQLFRNCRLIGRRFRLAHVVFGREIVEVATLRGQDGEGEREVHDDGRILRDNIWGSIEEDALRRDFRVNALYYDISDFSVRDYVGGLEDLRSREMHLIGDPQQRYREDPVRMLRAARLSAKLDFEIAAASAAPIAELAPLLADVAPARLFDEALKLFMAGHGLASFHQLERHGLLRWLLPALAAALTRDRDGALRRMTERALANTDARVREDKPVTPAFTFAVLLWSEVQSTALHLLESGVEVSAAWHRAGQMAIAEQARRVAIPRRFGVAMEEIWALQPRFAVRTARGRVQRLLAHPRFRAAYDFLQLRVEQEPALAELAAWWTTAQERPGAVLPVPPESVAPAQSVPVDGAAPKAARRRRRGGQRKRNPGGGDA